jgi:hypothetical protein
MLRWKLLDAVSTSNLVSFARCLTPLDVFFHHDTHVISFRVDRDFTIPLEDDLSGEGQLVKYP